MKLSNSFRADADVRIEFDGNMLNYKWAEYLFDGTLVYANDTDYAISAHDEAMALIATAKKPITAEETFIRFGELPKSGKSRNWSTGKNERGVSCYRSTYNILTGAYNTYGALPGAEISYLMRNANIYLITGDVVGVGSDGEPVINNAKIVAQLALTDDGYMAV